MRSLGGSGGAQPSTWRLLSTLQTDPLVAYFVLAYGFSWAMVIGLYLLGVPDGLVIGVATIGPTFGAVSMTLALEGQEGLIAWGAELQYGASVTVVRICVGRDPAGLSWRHVSPT